MTQLSTIEKGPIGPRISSLIASLFVALASGTPYVYSVYAPQLIKNSNLSVSDAAQLSFALAIGGGIGGFPAGIIIDNLGPQIADFIGSILTFISFKTLHSVYENKSTNIFVISLSLCLSSFSSVLCFFSTINCVTANFPHHRGTAGAIPVSFYALAALLYSAISVRFFEKDTGGLLKFFTYFASIICFVGSFFLVIVDKKNKKKPTHPSTASTSVSSLSHLTENDPLIRRPSSVVLFREAFTERRKSIQHHLSLWGIGRSPSSSSFDNIPNRPIIPVAKTSRSDSEAIYVAVEDVPIFVRLGKSPIWNHHIFKAVFSRLYLKFIIILCVLQSVGQTYIYSVGYLIVTLETAKPGQNDNDSVLEAQAVQVSTLAIASFLGRLTSGPISDIVSKKFKFQRIWCIWFASILMAFGQLLVTRVNNLDNLIFPSFVNGFSFGFVFGTFPAVLADSFGTNGFSTLWGILTMGSVFIIKVLSKNLAYNLKKNSDENGVCKLAAACYEDTFYLTHYACLAISALVLFTIYINHRIARNAHATPTGQTSFTV